MTHGIHGGVSATNAFTYTDETTQAAPSKSPLEAYKDAALARFPQATAIVEAAFSSTGEGGGFTTLGINLELGAMRVQSGVYPLDAELKLLETFRAP